MENLRTIIKKLIQFKEQGQTSMTLLAVCPNSQAVLEAAVIAAARNRCLMLFAATLNQVDVEDSYTGWTPESFVRQMYDFGDRYQWSEALIPCLDHGGPWLKDLHTLTGLSYSETILKVKESIAACIQAGYKLLHIDPTIDRTIPRDQILPLEVVVSRSIELIKHAEQIRNEFHLPPVAYEVGTEEVHGGMVNRDRFVDFIKMLRDNLERNHLEECWPCFFVAQVGTDLHTTNFDRTAAVNLYSITAPTGSLIKGHYTDWVDNPADYPASGMGGANVGPEFTAQEYQALKALEDQERAIGTFTTRGYSNFINTLQTVIHDSGRWKKWLLPGEIGLEFSQLPPDRQEWLFMTGSRYVWSEPGVLQAREKLYHNLVSNQFDPHAYVIERIIQGIEKYIQAFNLVNSIDRLRS